MNDGSNGRNGAHFLVASPQRHSWFCTLFNTPKKTGSRCVNKESGEFEGSSAMPPVTPPHTWTV